jgi:hypothetical protein
MKLIKNLTFAALAAAALAATLQFQTSIALAHDHGQRGDDNERGDHDRRIDHQFVILLAGVYKPVALGHGPRHNLGLTTVDLNNGKWSKVKIYLVSGLPGDQDQDEDKAIGAFYAFGGTGIVAYDLPKGSFSAKFLREHDDQESLPGADGSFTLDGTFKLDILEATGIYRPFVGGHIHMVDILKFRADDGTFLENCFCTIHPKLVAP